MVILEALKTVNLKTTNLEDSINFYTNYLDFDMVSQNEEEAILTFDQLSIKVVLSDKIIENEDHFPALSFILDIDDFTDAIQETEEKKVFIFNGPNEIDGGESLVVKDPGGNAIELFYKD